MLDTLRDLLWLTPTEALAVVLATTGMYVALMILVRVIGQRMLGAMSNYDLVAVIAFGAILGRAALGDAAVLGGGLVALLTLIVLQSVAGALIVRPLGARAITTAPIVLMADGQVLAQQLRRAHVASSELASRLRLAGVHRYDDVAVALLEPTGAISVLRRGTPVDAELLDGAVGAELVPQHLLASRAGDA
ncbi:DUF421 domain-containing protein [Isoptericola rhizosphaerae]|uniref:DUF421 domain-containing protein n=1 Tax=Isoptericola rhizosphaerae TaxID=3377837 RepID=UPI00383A9932